MLNWFSLKSWFDFILYAIATKQYPLFTEWENAIFNGFLMWDVTCYIAIDALDRILAGGWCSGSYPRKTGFLGVATFFYGAKQGSAIEHICSYSLSLFHGHLKQHLFLRLWHVPLRLELVKNGAVFPSGTSHVYSVLHDLHPKHPYVSKAILYVVEQAKSPKSEHCFPSILTGAFHAWCENICKNQK